MSQGELRNITKQYEKRTIEYKEAYSELPGNLFETVCAFLNRDGGIIVLGVHDDGTITDGVNPRAIIEITRDGIIAKNANRPLKAEIVTLDNYERHPKNPTWLISLCRLVVRNI